MATDDGQPVSHWLSLLKAGNHHSAQPLWELYFARLVRLVHARLPASPAVDEEVLAASAFRSFWLAAAGGRFPRLNDRHDLWRILVAISGQKIADELERASAGKRGGGLAPADPSTLAFVVSDYPTPEMAASVKETLQRLLADLGDDYRHVAVWKMEGYTNEEIADRLGCAVRTVANRLDVIRRVLRREVAR